MTELSPLLHPGAVVQVHVWLLCATIFGGSFVGLALGWFAGRNRESPLESEG